MPVWLPGDGVTEIDMGSFAFPRVVVAGLAGDAGKTLVSIGLARALRRRGLRVAPFKKGPDYIDPAWLACAAGQGARNLDTFLMSPEAITQSLEDASGADIAVIEGNRGLFDGVDADGTHSTAELAKLLKAPVILVIDVSKSTRTVAALVLGCLALDPQLPLAGIILNRVGSKRQERIIREAIARVSRVPVLGAVPRLPLDHLPSRHLGLLMPGERSDCEPTLDALANAIESAVDVEAIHCLADAAPRLPTRAPATHVQPGIRPGVRIGVLRDEAFCFYYRENLAALEAEGAELVFISPLRDRALPAINALYAGGGYPEEHAAAQTGRPSAIRVARASRRAAFSARAAACSSGYPPPA
jgi:cobyrinic acid a,c-diamide synthase